MIEKIKFPQGVSAKCFLKMFPQGVSFSCMFLKYRLALTLHHLHFNPCFPNLDFSVQPTKMVLFHDMPEEDMVLVRT